MHILQVPNQDSPLGSQPLGREDALPSFGLQCTYSCHQYETYCVSLELSIYLKTIRLNFTIRPEI